MNGYNGHDCIVVVVVDDDVIDDVSDDDDAIQLGDLLLSCSCSIYSYIPDRQQILT